MNEREKQEQLITNIGLKKIGGIKHGDKVRCLTCGEEFEITEKTFQLTPEKEKIVCPHCKGVLDVVEYMLQSLDDPRPIIKKSEVRKFGRHWILRVEYCVGDQDRCMAAKLT